MRVAVEEREKEGVGVVEMDVVEEWEEVMQEVVDGEAPWVCVVEGVKEGSREGVLRVVVDRV